MHPTPRRTEESLRQRFGESIFHVGGHPMTLSNFFDYCASTTDEMPLYLFDKVLMRWMRWDGMGWVRIGRDSTDGMGCS